MNFPVYRKYKNGRSYFRILNEKEFEEIRISGSRAYYSRVQAKQLPELNFIQDLLYNFREMAEPATAPEFERARLSVV